MSEVLEKQMIFTTKIVDEMTDKINDGIVLKRFQNPWLKGEVGIRRTGATFRMTLEEQAEYIKCATDIHYFTEKYCKVKTEDGSINNITLRDYQKDIFDTFTNNRKIILNASRQIGKCLIFNELCNTYENNIESLERIGIIYYRELSKIRPLTFFEKLKIELYNILFILENIQAYLSRE